MICGDQRSPIAAMRYVADDYPAIRRRIRELREQEPSVLECCCYYSCASGHRIANRDCPLHGFETRPGGAAGQTVT
jgi:hypothetical protein